MTAWKRDKALAWKFLLRVFALKMDKFLVKPKKKPCSITPQERKFHVDDNLLFCSTSNVVVDHHRKSVLDNHLSAVSHIKRMNESSSKRAKQQTLKTSFKCKTPAKEEKKTLHNSHNSSIIRDFGHTIHQKIVHNLRKKTHNPGSPAKRKFMTSHPDLTCEKVPSEGGKNLVSKA